MKKDVQDLSETAQVPFDELFSESFMQEYTSFSSMDELLKAGGFSCESEKDFDSIPEDALDQYISSITSFDKWEDMVSEAASQYIEKKIVFLIF